MDSNSVIGYENDGTEIKLGDLQKKLKEMLFDVVEVLNKNKINYFASEGTLLGAVRHGDIIPWDDDVDLGFMIDEMDLIIETLNKELDSKYVVQCYQNDKNYNVTQPIIKIRMKGTSVDYDAWYDKNHCDCNGIFIDLIAFSYTNSSLFRNKYDRFVGFFNTLLLIAFNYLGINIKWLKELHINRAIKHNKRNYKSNEIGYAINFMCWKKYSFNSNDFFPTQPLKFDYITFMAPKNYDGILSSMYGDYMTIPKSSDVRLYHSKNIKLKEI